MIAIGLSNGKIIPELLQNKGHQFLESSRANIRQVDVRFVLPYQRLSAAAWVADSLHWQRT